MYESIRRRRYVVKHMRKAPDWRHSTIIGVSQDNSFCPVGQAGLQQEVLKQYSWLLNGEK